MAKVGTIPRSGLVGEWKLDGDALDTSGSGNNGTATNVTYTNTDRGYQKQCGVFNGTSSSIVTGGTVQTCDNVSFSFFCKWTSQVSNGWVVLKDNIPGLNNANIGVYARNSDGKFVINIYDGVAFEVATTGVYNDGNWHHIIFTYNKSTTATQLFIDNKIDINTTSGKSITSKEYVHIGYAGTYGGNVQGVRIYNYVLSTQEIQSLYMEGLRKLGGSGLAPLTDGLVAMFEIDGSTPLYDVVNGTVATYAGGTATTDYFGNTKALTNPNYTWSSITYTTGYTFENSGGGWSLVTSPAGLSATGINRTTTLGRIFLFSRTLSASEITSLELLCKNSYPYPF